MTVAVPPATERHAARSASPASESARPLALRRRSDLIVTSDAQGRAEFGVWALLVDPPPPAPSSMDEP